MGGTPHVTSQKLTVCIACAANNVRGSTYNRVVFQEHGTSVFIR